MDYKRIVVFGPNWIGDAVMAAPMIASLRRGLPKAKITLITKAYLYDMWKTNPNLDQIFCFDLFKFPCVPGYLSLARLFGRERFEAAIILPHYFCHAVSTYLAGVSLRIGYDVRGRGFLLTKSFAFDDELRKYHMVMNYIDFLKPLGIPPAPPGPATLNIDPAWDKLAQQILGVHGIGAKGPLIGLAPSARYGPSKRWPVSSYAELAGRIFTKYGVKPYIFTGPYDRQVRDALKRHVRDTAIFLDSHLSLGVVAALIQKCRLLVSNDSGLMHVADAVGTKTVGIFGSTSPVWNRPYGSGHTILKKEFACSPCFKRRCGDKTHPCLTSISVEEVMEAVRAQLAPAKTLND